MRSDLRRTTIVATMTLTALLSSASVDAQGMMSPFVRFSEFLKPAPCTKAEAEQAKLTLKDPARLREVYDQTIAGAWWYDPSALPFIDEMLSCARYHDLIAGKRDDYQTFLRRAAYVNFHNPIYDPREQQPSVVSDILSRIDPDDEYFKRFIFQAAQHYQQSIDDYAAREGWSAFSARWLGEHPPESADIVLTCLTKIEDEKWLKEYLRVAAATLETTTLILKEEKREVLHPELLGAMFFVNSKLDTRFDEEEREEIRREFYALLY